MGNLCTSNEPTLEEKLRDQLCRIVKEYEAVDLTCGYIAIFEMSVASARPTPATNPNTLAAPDLLPPTHSNSSSMVNNNDNNLQHYKNGYSHSHSFNNQHHYTSSTRSNLKVKVKAKKEITKITELDYTQFIQWKIEEIKRAIEEVKRKNPDITEQQLKDEHGLEINSSSNNILRNISISKRPSQGNANVISAKIKDMNDEKEALLPADNKEDHSYNDNLILNDGSTTNNIHDIKNILQNNDIKSSVQSLGDTTDQLLQILDRAKVIHKMRNHLGNKIIHIRGNKKTIFSYYLILNKYIIICYSEYSKSIDLEFKEWIKIQSKLEKLQITLKDMEQLLTEDKKN